MGKKGRIAEYRERLDQTLMCNDLMNKETLASLVKDQVLHSQDNENHGHVANTSLLERIAELSNLLDMLRSVSDDYVTLRNKCAHPSWKVCFSVMLAGLCLAWESAIYQDWFPVIRIPTFKIDTAKCLQKIRIGEQISLVRVKLSWPLTDREAVLRYFEFEYFEDDLIIVVLNSVSDAENIISQTKGYTDDEIAEAGQRVRVGLVGGFAFQKVTEDRSYFRTIINLDMKLEFVPPSLINFISRQLIGSAFKLYQKSVASISDGNVKFVKVLNDPIYRHIREALYLRRKPDSSLENVVQGDDRTDSEEHYESALDEFPDEDDPLYVSEDTHESSSRHDIDLKSSCIDVKDSAHVPDYTTEISKSTDEPHGLDAVTASCFKEKKVLLCVPVEDALGTFEISSSLVRTVSLTVPTNPQ